MQAVAIAKVVLALIPLVSSGAEHLFAFVTSIRTAALQSGTWPADAEAAYQARLLAKADAPPAQSDAAIGIPSSLP
jgi:hypothetical protein